MRILLIMDPGISVPPLNYGGIERIVHLLANEYHRLGHQITLLAGPKSKCNGSTIHFGTNNLHRSTWRKRKEFLFVWSFLLEKKNEYDVVHNFGRLIYLLPILNNKVIKLMSYQRAVTAQNINLITRLPNKNLHFTACSDYCKSTGNYTGSWHTVYNAVDFSKYDLNPVSDETMPLMFLGRLDKIKGLHTAILIAKASGRRLLVAGNIPDTADNLIYYNKHISSQFDGKQIKYIGELNDEEKNHFLRKSAALLFPIEWEEPFGIVMIEAMACGTPVIAFGKGAVGEVVDHKKTGLIANDYIEMLQFIEAIPDIDRTKCRLIAKERFDIRNVALQYITLACDC
jgi:glycosyltransferase involved in cell wall biosynthesis